jgi:hypothetical protein
VSKLAEFETEAADSVNKAMLEALEKIQVNIAKRAGKINWSKIEVKKKDDSQPVVLLPMPIVWPKTSPALNTNLTFDTPWLSAAQVATKKSDPVVKRNKDSEQISASTLVASRPSVVDPRLATFLERFDNAEWRLQALQAKNAELQAKVQEAERQKRAMQQLAR